MASQVTNIMSTGVETPVGETKNGAAEETPGATKEMFLQLLVAQIQNQDPMNPADGTQYLTQLAEFSNLEQMIAIRDEVAAIRDSVETAILLSGSEAETSGTEQAD